MATQKAERPVFSGFISFGLFSTPIKLYVAGRPEGTTRSSGETLHFVHPCDSGNVSRVKQVFQCEGCAQYVDRDLLKRGIEVEEGKCAVVDENKLAGLDEDRTSTIPITGFVKRSEIDPLYFDKSYYVVGQDAGRLAYDMLYEAMKDTDLAGRGTLTMGRRTYNVFVRVYRGGLVLHTMLSYKGVRTVSSFEQVRSEVPASFLSHIQSAKHILSQMVVPFDPASLVDTFEEKRSALIEETRDGIPRAVIGTTTVDVAALLERSLLMLRDQTAAAQATATGAASASVPPTPKKKGGKRAPRAAASATA